MSAIRDSANAAGFDDSQIHQEFFAVPDMPDYNNEPFRIQISSTGQQILVAEDETASDALIRNGFAVDVKCSDGLCGVCQCGYLEGAVAHRDFVLSADQKSNTIILCQSRARDKDGTIILDL